MRLTVDRRRTDYGLPADWSEIESHLRVSPDSGEMMEVQRMVLAAMREIEEAAQIALFDQQIVVGVEGFDRRDWPLTPIRPVNLDHPIRLTHQGEVHVLEAVSWHDVRHLPRPAFELTAPFVVTYTAGFGTTPAQLPEDLMQAVLDQASAYFDLRGNARAETPHGLSAHAARIIGRYRGVRL